MPGEWVAAAVVEAVVEVVDVVDVAEVAYVEEVVPAVAPMVADVVDVFPLPPQLERSMAQVSSVAPKRVILLFMTAPHKKLFLYCHYIS